MDHNVKHSLYLAVLLLLLCCLVGCVKPAHRLYAGPPLSDNETVLVYAVAGAAIYDIRDARETELKGLKRINLTTIVELLPGQYIAGIRYLQHSGSSEIRGGRIEIGLPVRAGNIYVVYPEIAGPLGTQTWRPAFVNIDSYNKEECMKNNAYSGSWDCPGKEEIRKWATEYLQGERLSMRYHKYKTPLLIPKNQSVEGYIIDGDWEE